MAVTAAATGVRVIDATLFGIALFLSTSVGVSVWWLLAPRGPRSTFEITGVGTVLGAGVLIGIDQTLRLAGNQDLLWVFLCLAAGIAYAAMWWHRGQVAAGIRADALPLLVAGAISCVALVPIFRENAISLPGLIQVNGDAPYREAVSNSVHLVGPGASLLVEGGTTRYHWLGNGWVGAMNTLTDAIPFVTQVRFLPLVAFLAIALMAWGISRSITPSRISGAAAVTMAVLGGALGLRLHDAGGQLTNSFGTSVLFAAMAAMAAFAIWHAATQESQQSTVLPAAALALATFLAAGSRLTTGAIVVAAGCLAAVSYVRSEARGRQILLAAATLVGAGAGFLLFASVPAALPSDYTPTWWIRFSDFFLAYQGLIPIASTIGVAVGVLALIVGVTVPLLGVCGFGSWREAARQPGVRWGLGAVVAGLLGLFLTYNYGLSHFTFLSPAMAPMLLMSGVGAGIAVTRLRSTDPPTRGFLYAAGAIYALALAIAVVTLGLIYGIRFDAIFRWSAPFVAAVGISVGALALGRIGGRASASVTYWVAVLAVGVTISTSVLLYGLRSTMRPLIGDNPATWTVSEVAAGEWLEQNVGLDVLVASNRQCDHPGEEAPACVSAINNIPALGSRRALIEGAFYSVGSAMKDVWPQLQGRFEDIRMSVEFGDHPKTINRDYLWERGVRYVWIDTRFTPNREWSPLAEEVFADGNVRILELTAPE